MEQFITSNAKIFTLIDFIAVLKVNAFSTVEVTRDVPVSYTLVEMTKEGKTFEGLQVLFYYMWANSLQESSLANLEKLSAGDGQHDFFVLKLLAYLCPPTLSDTVKTT